MFSSRYTYSPGTRGDLERHLSEIFSGYNRIPGVSVWPSFQEFFNTLDKYIDERIAEALRKNDPKK